MALSREEFEQLRTDFLASQDDESNDEWYCTERDIADSVFSALHRHLFGSYDEMEARRLQYETLRKEFDPKLTAARSSPVHKTTRMKS